MTTEAFRDGLHSATPRRLKGARGASAVEFALILPLLLVLVFGIVEFSLLLYDQAVITNASREGARFGIVVTEGTRKSVPDIQNRVSSYAASRLITFASVTLDSQVPSGPCTEPLDDLQVLVNYQYHLLLFPGFIAAFFGGGPGDTIPLRAQTTMMCE